MPVVLEAASLSISAIVGCRDLAAGDLSSGVHLLPGGVAKFTPSLGGVGVSAISQLVPNSASTRVYAIADNGSSLYAFTAANGTLQVLNSVRTCCSVLLHVLGCEAAHPP